MRSNVKDYKQQELRAIRLQMIETIFVIFLTEFYSSYS